jgi:hypothetical protein
VFPCGCSPICKPPGTIHHAWRQDSASQVRRHPKAVISALNPVILEKAGIRLYGLEDGFQPSRQ